MFSDISQQKNCWWRVHPDFHNPPQGSHIRLRYRAVDDKRSLPKFADMITLTVLLEKRLEYSTHPGLFGF